MKTTLLERLLESAQEVYLKYLTLELGQNSLLITPTDGGPKQSLEDYLSKLASTTPTDSTITVTMGDKTATWGLRKKAEGRYRLTAHLVKPVDLLPLNQYRSNPSLALELLSHQDFVLTKNQHGVYCLGTEITVKEKTHLLGGPDKVRLYRSHLVTLHNIINHLQSKQRKSLLIALATGAGKTFIQALWFLILRQAGVNGLFALPDNLIPQFCADMGKLLPIELSSSEHTKDIKVLRKGAGERLIQ